MTNEAKFNFYINRQGIRGRKGEKGDTGFSPTVEVNTNTAAEYTLKITNEDGEFVTDNLRGSAVEDRGGTYMRYDTETQEMYAGNPDSAATDQAGVVFLADQESIEAKSGATALTPEGFVDNLKTFLKSSDSSVSITRDEEDSKTDLTVDLSGISGDISGLESRMTGCESAINTIENTAIPAIQGDVDQLELDVAGKVDKVAGKGLSTNDFTDEDNDKLMHAVVDSDLADVAFTGDYDDLANKPTIPVIPTNNLTGDSVDGTTIVYNSETGKISATAQTPDLSNYMTLNSAQNVPGTKYYEGDALKVKNSTSGSYGNVAAYDNTVYPTTIENFSQAGGVMIGGLPNAGLKTLTAQWMTEYDSTLQDYRLAQIFNDYNLIGGTNVSIIKNSTTGLYEIVAHDTTYTEGNGIDISNANVISAKVDGTTIVINNNGELEATAQTPDLSNYVDKTTTQTISGAKTFSASSSNVTFSKGFNCGNSAGTPYFSVTKGGSYGQESTTLNVPSNFVIQPNGAGSTYGSVIIGGYKNSAGISAPYYHDFYSSSNPYYPIAHAGNLTSTGGTVTITQNGAAINLEANASAPSNMVTTDTQQTISGRKTFTGGILQQNTTYFGDTTTSSNYCGRISLNGGNHKNVEICGGGSYGSEKGSLKLGYESNGTYYDMQGVFIASTPSTSSSYTSEIGLKLGSINNRCSIAGQGGQIKLTANALNPNKNYLKIANNSLTYVDNSGTSHDLLASGSGGVQKVTETNPALTPNASNQCAWAISNSLGTNEVIVQIYEVSTGTQITNADINATSSTITILLPSSTNINAGTYRAIIIG